MFGLFDPTGKQDIPADSVTCASQRTHALSVPTGMLVADSTGAFALERTNADMLDEQARSLLEDMPIGAIKVGSVPGPEAASAIASIAADYSDAPLVLHLPPADGLTQSEDNELDVDHVDPNVACVLELLVPLATAVVLPASASRRWLNEEVLHELDTAQGGEALHLLGATWCLTTGFAQRPGSLIHLLQGPEGQTVSLPCAPLPQRVQDISGLISTALACALAAGLAMPDAVRLAIDYADQATGHAFQAGMGQQLARRWLENQPS